jgi:hypothetical protein
MRNVTRTEKFTRMSGSVNAPTLTLWWRLFLDCGHVKEQSSSGRCEPSSRAKCRICAAPPPGEVKP